MGDNLNRSWRWAGSAHDEGDPFVASGLYLEKASYNYTHLYIICEKKNSRALKKKKLVEPMRVGLVGNDGFVLEP